MPAQLRPMAPPYSLTTRYGVHVGMPDLIQVVAPTLDRPKNLYHTTTPTTTPTRPLQRDMDDYMDEVRRLFTAPLSPRKLKTMSTRLQLEFRESLQSSNICMLPSYNHTLPTGRERGTYLALDVGGSSFRVALIELRGNDGCHILISKACSIDGAVRLMEGQAFFDWMADRIEEFLAQGGAAAMLPSDRPLQMGLAWSFPVEQRSVRSGCLLPMGKGFKATQGLIGEDLADLIMEACAKRNLKVRLDAIVNDSSATLLSRAYHDRNTRIALILGTGTNAAIHLPVSSLSPSKFGLRPRSWHDKASHVLVNTELSMFGKHVLPTTRWDDRLNANHSHPDFQPLEHLVSGRYLGEIVRLVLAEAVQTAGLFAGHMPQGLDEPYSLDTGTLAAIQADTSASLVHAAHALHSRHPLPGKTRPLHPDLSYLQQIVELVSSRATAYLATGIHALWTLRLRAEGLDPASADEISIACDGTVLEKYPGFREQTQAWVDTLTGTERKVRLEMAWESALLGAAVAVSCVEDGDAAAAAA